MSTPKTPRRGRPEDRAAVIEHENRVLSMRMAGKTMAAIEKELGITNAHRVYKRALSRLNQPREEAFKLEVARLDELQRTIWDAARDGDLAAFDRVLKTIDQRSRLMGLNHSDRAADKANEIEADKAKLMAYALGKALDGLGLTEEQAHQAQVTLIRELRVGEELESLL